MLAMEWSESGIVLSARRHGETSSLVMLFTAQHGRHAGLVRGGQGRRARGLYQAGNVVSAVWRARLDEHLGNYRCELVAARAAGLLDDALRLAALSSACAVVEAALPERHPYPALYAAFLSLGEDIASAADWGAAYARFELMLLAELGFGLDLSACAVTGEADDLQYVSPRSGRAVSAAAGEGWREKLLLLPAFLWRPDAPPPAQGDLRAALNLTGWFLAAHIFADASPPPARERFLERLAREG
jgi:DNA repair protein RecO (recombination protein O)